MREDKKRALFAACLALILIVSAFAFLAPENEPIYQGRKLSSWLIQRAQPPSSYPRSIKVFVARINAADDAIRQIGTNGLPYLVKWIHFPAPTPVSRCQVFLAKIRNGSRIGHLVVPQFVIEGHKTRLLRYEGAKRAFVILGPTASAAAPALYRDARTARDWNTAAACVQALSLIGPEAVPYLCGIITNPPPPSWTNALDRDIPFNPQMSPRIFAISSLATDQTKGISAIPALVQAATDQELHVAAQAVVALGVLGDGQPAAGLALTNALRDPRPLVRTCANKALHDLGLMNE